MLGSNLSILGKSSRNKNHRRASRISNRQVSAVSLAHHEDGNDRAAGVGVKLTLFNTLNKLCEAEDLKVSATTLQERMMNGVKNQLEKTKISYDKLMTLIYKNKGRN